VCFAAKLLLATILCLMGASALAADPILEGNYNVTAVCTAVKTGTQLGSIESCQDYYVCSSSGPVKNSCQAGYSYAYTKSGCYPSSQVDCYWGLSEPCSGKNGTWVPNTAVCGGYFYCDEGKSSAPKRCGSGQVFDASSKSCVWGSCNDNLVETEGTTLNTICDVVPPGIWFGDTQACDIWYTCQSTTTGIKQTSGTCPIKTPEFNPQTQICGYPSATVCSRVTGIPISDAGVSCATNGDTKPDVTVCGQYLQCVNKQWTKVACAFGYYWDVESSGCKLREAATPVDTCNRCQFAKQSFVNAVDSDNCRNYLFCPSSGQPTALTCPEEHFFNEDIQGCAPDSGLDTYVATHGACYGATVAGSSTDSDDSSTPEKVA
ncbi:hypothetical protein M5D96_010476, partial [Drosophila gunungcola]